MDGSELSQALLELVNDEAKQVECSVVDSTVAHCDRSSNALRTCIQLGEVDGLLSDRLNLTGNNKLHVVDSIRPYLVTNDTSQQTEIVRQLKTCNLSVDELMDGQGHCT